MREGEREREMEIRTYCERWERKGERETDKDNRTFSYSNSACSLSAVIILPPTRTKREKVIGRRYKRRGEWGLGIKRDK